MNRISAKTRILDTASKLFSLNGYGNVGINEIIKDSNTAKASFYQHYPSKEDLCVAWLESVHSNSVTYHESLLDSDKDPLDIIIDYFESLKKYLVEHSYRSCPFSNTGSFLNSKSEKVREQIKIHKSFLEDFFIKLINKKSKDSNHSEKLGNLLFLLYSGASTEAQNTQSVKPVDNAINIIRTQIKP